MKKYNSPVSAQVLGPVPWVSWEAGSSGLTWQAWKCLLQAAAWGGPTGPPSLSAPCLGREWGALGTRLALRDLRCCEGHRCRGALLPASPAGGEGAHRAQTLMPVQSGNMGEGTGAGWAWAEEPPFWVALEW